MAVNILALANNTEFDASRAAETGLSALDSLISEAEGLVSLLKGCAKSFEECGTCEADEELRGKGNVLIRASDNARRILSSMELHMQELSESGATLYALSSILPQLIALNAENKED